MPDRRNAGKQVPNYCSGDPLAILEDTSDFCKNRPKKYDNWMNFTQTSTKICKINFSNEYVNTRNSPFWCISGGSPFSDRPL